MRKILGIILLSVSAVFAARAVDYQALEVEVSMDPAGYRALLDRFIAADSTLTTAETAKVYYGFALTPSYEPRDTFPEIREAFNRGDYAEVERLIGPALALNPVSLDLIYMGMTVYEKGFGTTPGAKAMNLAVRYDKLVGAILDSGRGTSAQSPFYVICDNDRRHLLHGVLRVGDILGQDTVGDILAVKFYFPGKSRMHILYFDVTVEKNYLSTHPR